MADSGRQLSTQPVEMNITGQVIQCDCKRKNLYSRIHHPNEERYLLIILLFVLLLGFFCLFGEERGVNDIWSITSEFIGFDDGLKVVWVAAIDIVLSLLHTYTHAYVHTHTHTHTRAYTHAQSYASEGGKRIKCDYPYPWAHSKISDTWASLPE